MSHLYDESEPRHRTYDRRPDFSPSGEAVVTAFAPRPDHGTRGRLLTDVETNSYRMKMPKNIHVFMYHVTVKTISEVMIKDRGRGRGRGGGAQNPPRRKMVTKDVRVSVLKRLMFWHVIREAMTKHHQLIFDDKCFCWSLDPLPRPTLSAPHPDKKSDKVEVQFRFLDEYDVCLGKEEMFALDEFRFELSEVFFKNLMTQNARYTPNTIENDPNMQFWRDRGSMMFIPRVANAPQVIAAPGVQAWLGFYATVKQLENFDPVLHFGLVNKLFYALNMDLVTFYRQMINEMQLYASMSAVDEDLAMGTEQKTRFLKKLAGIKLKSDFAPINDRDSGRTKMGTRHYKLEGLGHAASLEKVDGIPVPEWYKIFNVKLKYPNLPVGIVKSGKKTDIVPLELLFTHDTPQKYAKLLSLMSQKQLTTRLAREPKQHQKYTQRLLDKLQMHEDEFLKEFGISVDTSMLECTGRVLPPPDVVDGREEMDGLIELEEGTNDFTVNRFIRPFLEPFQIVMVKVTDRISESEIRKFSNSLKEKCIQFGLEASLADQVVHFDNFVPKDYCDHNKYVVLFFVDENSEAYGMIKHVMDVQKGLISQVIKTGTLKKAENQLAVFSNISLKLNAKLGGVNHCLGMKGGSPTGRGRPIGVPGHSHTMFVGIDVTHPAPQDDLDISIASIVASVDQFAATYVPVILVQPRCNETVQPFGQKFSHLLLEHKKGTGRWPDKVVVLRDGVSNSQMLDTASRELHSMMANRAIQSAWSSVTGNYMPKFTYIVVQKRTKTRFYQKNGVNIPSGSTFDTYIVHPSMFDFYLASHFAQKGTTNPPRYTVVFDESKMTSDEVQEMCFNLCFLYARCSKPVHIPAPVYYAHLACERARYHYRYALNRQYVEMLPSYDKDRVTVDKYREEVDQGAKEIEKELQVHSNYEGMYFV